MTGVGLVFASVYYYIQQDRAHDIITCVYRREDYNNNITLL